MSQTVITTAFEALKAQQAAANTPVVLDEFVFANVPGLNITDPIDPAEALPAAGQIVHRATVSKTGVVNANAVVYSVTLGADVGNFAFNWVGLMDKASNTLAMIVHAPLQQKVKNNAGTQGNVLTRSFLMEYDGAKKETQITTPAGTWQIDFTARLAGMDERQRIENIDIYGTGAFIGDGFLVKRSGNNYSVTAGAGYVGGLRAELTAELALTVTTKPVKVWVDTSFTGTLTSAWVVNTAVTVADTLIDYMKNDVNHYVFAIAQINADGSITDLRPKGSKGEQQANTDFLRKDANLNDLKDKSEARKSLELKSAALKDTGRQPGQVMTVGEFGLGGEAETAPAPQGIMASGFYRYGGNGDGDNIHSFKGFGSILSINYGESLFQTSQLFIPAGGNGYEAKMRWQTLEGVSWSSYIYHEGHKPTADEVDAVSASKGGVFKKAVTIEDKVTAKSYTANNMPPAGSGGYSQQMLSEAPYYIPEVIVEPHANMFIPLIKGGSIIRGEGYQMRMSLGMLTSADIRYANPVLHVVMDGDRHATWEFNISTGDIISYKYGLVASQKWVNEQSYSSKAEMQSGDNAVKDWVIQQTFIPRQEVANAIAGVNQTITNWANQNFVQGLRFGAVEQTQIFQAPGYSDQLGYVITGVVNNAPSNLDGIVDFVQRRPLQININGSWMNVGQ